jgi:hypothetical protein
MKAEIAADSMPLAELLAGMTEDGMARWMKDALNGNTSPLQLAPGDFPSAVLAGVPQQLTGDVLARYRSVTARLLAEFSMAPLGWDSEQAAELIVLAGLLGTPCLPGREPWDLAFPLTLKRLVEANSAEFEMLAFPLRLQILSLLANGPVGFNKEFWQTVANANLRYVPLAWRGLLRDDWRAACEMLPTLPDDAESLRNLRYHARAAARRMKADETGQLRVQMQIALPGAKEQVRQVLLQEAGELDSLPTVEEELIKVLGLERALDAVLRARLYAGKEDITKESELLEIVRNFLRQTFQDPDHRVILLMDDARKAHEESGKTLPPAVGEIVNRWNELHQLS